MKRSQMLFSSLVMLTLGLGLLAPSLVNAQSYALNYTPRTNAEKIAYLYGRISQLMEIKQSLEKDGQSGGVNALFDYITVETYSASEETETTAVLRGEVLLFGEEKARAWFEYGQDIDFLDLRTSQKTVSTAYDRPVRIAVSRLEDDKKYYYRIVATDKNKVVHYGEISTFRTEESED